MSKEQEWLSSAETGDLARMRSLVDRGVNIDCSGAGDATALMRAAAGSWPEVVAFLLSLGVRVDACDGRGERPLHHAARSGNATIVRRLLDSNAAPEERSSSGMTALAIASDRGHLESVQLLLERGASANSANRAMRTPLHDAIARSRGPLVSMLFDHDASIDAVDAHGHSPLDLAEPQMRLLAWWHAAQRGDVGRVRLLLARAIGADGDEGWRDLGRALYQPEGQDTLLLNLHREQINARQADGFTALSLAAQHGHAALAGYLLSQVSRETPWRAPARAPPPAAHLAR